MQKRTRLLLRSRNEFTGKERDSESGLDYFGARYFGSALGRFTSPDPLLNSGRPGNPQSWNRYAYALNNPISSVDPTGLFTWDQSFGGGCTDKQLSGGKCDGFDKKQGKGIVKDRKAFRDQLNQLNNSGYASLSATGAAIGTEGKDNGVHVFLGGVDAGAAAQVDSSKPLSLDLNGNPILDLHVRDGAAGDSLFIGLAHEGSHIWDAQSVASGNQLFILHGTTELDGYLETVRAAQYLGWANVQASGQTLWNSSWSTVDQQSRPPQEIMKLLQTSPLYKDKLDKVAFTK